jgi:mono/diheme cytochrome c family protein
MNKLLLLTLIILAASVGAGRAADAKAIYDKSCAKCHGADGKGGTTMGRKLGVKDYTDAKVQAELKDDVASKAIKEGLKDKSGKTLMKPAEGLSDEDIKGLVAYMRSFKK